MPLIKPHDILNLIDKKQGISAIKPLTKKY
jgi:hypothetical protein